MTETKTEDIIGLNQTLSEVQSLYSELAMYILSADYSTYVIRSRLDQITVKLRDIVDELFLKSKDILLEPVDGVASTLNFIIDHCTNIIISLGYLYRRDTKTADFHQKEILDLVQIQLASIVDKLEDN